MPCFYMYSPPLLWMQLVYPCKVEIIVCPPLWLWRRYSACRACRAPWKYTTLFKLESMALPSIFFEHQFRRCHALCWCVFSVGSSSVKRVCRDYLCYWRLICSILRWGRGVWGACVWWRCRWFHEFIVCSGLSVRIVSSSLRSFGCATTFQPAHDRGPMVLLSIPWLSLIRLLAANVVSFKRVIHEIMQCVWNYGYNTWYYSRLFFG